MIPIPEILTLDLSSASKNLVSTLASVDSAAQSIAPIVGVYRFQILAKEGKLADIEKKFPADSLAPSTLRNCKVYEQVFKDHVQGGLLTREAYMALSFADCRALIEARKFAKTGEKAASLRMLEAEREALKAGLAPKEVLAAVKKSDKKIVTAMKQADKQREENAKATQEKREAEKAAFEAWKESGSPAAEQAAPVTLPDSAHELAAHLWQEINTLKPRQRAAMADILRGMAERIESESAEMRPAENVIPMKQAA
jgi:hypothetical protein